MGTECQSCWTCPACRGRINRARAQGLTEAAAAAREIAAQLMAKHDADAEDKAAAMAMGLFARLIDLQARSVGSGS
jgi:hypothetical protein